MTLLTRAHMQSSLAVDGIIRAAYPFAEVSLMNNRRDLRVINEREK